VARRNACGGRSAQEHLVPRCAACTGAVSDGLIKEADNPAQKVAKPRRLTITRRSLRVRRPRRDIRLRRG
jgi:integrase/recombinase XerC